MPRNGSGTYTLPEAPFVPNTAILSAEVNSDFDDIADALTDSLASDGQTLLTGALRAFAGTLALPGWTWAVDTNTGRWHPDADEMQDVCGGVAVAEYTAAGVDFPVALTERGGTVVMPAGAIVAYAGALEPTGWFFCAGQSLLRATYPALFTAIGTAYGAADGTHFSLPDLRGRVPACKDDGAGRLTATTMSPDGNTLGAVGGAQTVTISQANLPNVNFNIASGQGSHVHTLRGNNTPGGGTSGSPLNNYAGDNGAGQYATADNCNMGANNIVAATLPAMTAASGGSGTATDKIQPTLITNYIIKT